MSRSTGLFTRARGIVVALTILFSAFGGVVLSAGAASAATRDQVDVGPDVDCNLNGLHQNQGPVSTCGNLTISTQVLVNGVDVPAGTVLKLGDVVTAKVTIPPRGGSDAFYQETVDGIQNNDGDIRFAFDVGLPGETGTNLSAPTNVVMSRTDQGDRGNSPALNCLFQNGQQGAVSDGPAPITIGGGPVGGTRMSAAVAGTTLTARWDQLAYDRCVNVYSNNGYYAGMTLSFDQTVTQLGTVPLQPTWTDGRVRLERNDGSHVIHWGTDADTNLTIPAAVRPLVIADAGIVDAFYPGQAATSVQVDPLANDSGVGVLRIASVTSTTAGGTVDCGVLPGAGPCTYTPPLGYSGTDTWNDTVADDNGTNTAQVTIVVKPNAAPIAQDDTASTSLNTPISGSLDRNDHDPDGDSLVYSTAPVSGPAHGRVTIGPSGGYTYTPDANFFGTDSFTYEVCDRHGMISGSDSQRCSRATATVTVTPGPLPQATPDQARTDEGTSVTVSVLDNDQIGGAGPLHVSFAGTSGTSGTTTAGGTVACTTTCTYTPPAGFSGTDAFTYTVTDAAGRSSSATVTVVVKGNHAPIAEPDAIVAQQDGPAVRGDLSANDVELDGEALAYDPTPVAAPTKGHVTIAPDGSLTYTPDAGASGTDTFTYRVCDDHELVDGTLAPKCSTAKVTVTITPTAKVPPIAVEDGLITDTDIPRTVDVLANDSDPDGPASGLSITFAGFGGTAGATQAGGAVACSATCTYTPPMGFSGTDVFRYTVTDPDGLTASAVVVIAVRGNHRPLAGDDFGVTPLGTPLHGDLSSNDTEIDGESLVYTTAPVVDPQHGSVRISADGHVVYTPDPGYAGADSFVYEVCDDHELVDGTAAPKCSQARAVVLIGEATVNDLPPTKVEAAAVNPLAGGGGGPASSSRGGSTSGGQEVGASALARTGVPLQPMVLLATILVAGGWALLRARRELAGRPR